MSDTRQTYADAIRFFISVVERIRPDQWNDPGLGVWTVRELVGHTSGALSNVERDLAAPAGPVTIENAVEFFETGLAIAGIAERVAERGREAGAALGSDPLAAIRALADRIGSLLADTPDETVVGIAFGPMRLPDYLPTKTFELIVHTLDIAAALGLSPDPPAEALAESVRIAVQLALRKGRGAMLLHALTGRCSLPSGFSVV